MDFTPKVARHLQDNQISSQTQRERARVILPTTRHLPVINALLPATLSGFHGTFVTAINDETHKRLGRE